MLRLYPRRRVTTAIYDPAALMCHDIVDILAALVGALESVVVLVSVSVFV